MTFPLVDQRPLIPDGATDCFEASLWAALLYLNHVDVGIGEILADHSGSTDLPTALRMCGDVGLTGCQIISGDFDNRDSVVIALFRDNAYAEPDSGGPLEHYADVYAQDATNVSMMNPWGGRIDIVPLTQFNPAYLGGILIPVSANMRQPAPPPVQFQSTLGGRPVVITSGQADSSVEAVGTSSTVHIKFATAFDHVPVVVVCSGDANEAGGAGGVDLNLDNANVKADGFTVQVLNSANKGPITTGTLVRINWIAV